MTRAQSQEATRVRLTQAAERVFVRFGFDAATVEQIAEAAGFSRGAFYSNFPDKDAIFLAVLNKRRIDAANALGEILRKNNNASERLRALREWYVNQCRQKQWTTLRMEFQLRALRNAAVRKRLAAEWREEVETYSALVDQYFSEAGVPMRNHPEAIAVSLLAFAQGLGSVTLVDPAWSSRPGLAEAQKLVFNLLAGVSGDEIPPGGEKKR